MLQTIRNASRGEQSTLRRSEECFSFAPSCALRVVLTLLASGVVFLSTCLFTRPALRARAEVRVSAAGSSGLHTAGLFRRTRALSTRDGGRTEMAPRTMVEETGCTQRNGLQPVRCLALVQLARSMLRVYGFRVVRTTVALRASTYPLAEARLFWYQHCFLSARRLFRDSARYALCGSPHQVPPRPPH